MKTLDDQFRRILEGKEPHNLYDPIRYILLQDGKRLRPQLVSLAVEMLGGDMEKARPIAMAFEMLHNFTLIHDDIMDAAPLRRGKETVYKKWNSNIAILSGDALAIMAFQQLLKLDCDKQTIIDIAEVFSATSLEICEGQQYDLDFETQTHVSIADYIKMIRLKTAVMFAGCLKAGALYMSADAKSAQALYDLGLNLGIAFQLEDDVLDVYADTPAFGKTIGGDIRDNKKTYLYLKALELANESQKKQLIELFASPTLHFEKKFKTVKDIYDELDVRGETEHMIRFYSEKCLRNIADVNTAEENKETFRQLVAKLMHRSK